MHLVGYLRDGHLGIVEVAAHHLHGIAVDVVGHGVSRLPPDGV